jgi:uncharacterized membrane protein YidH (DUF202 family)
MPKKKTTKREKSLKIEFIKKLTTLLASGFGLVAALAWNDAIQSLFKLIPMKNGDIVAKFAYAFLVTGIIVFVLFQFNMIS